MLAPVSLAAADSTPPDSVITTARAQLRQGLLDQAILALAPYVSGSGGEADPARLLTLKALDLAGRYEEARALAAQVKPDAMPDLVAEASEALAARGGENAARALLTSAVTAHPGDAAAPLRLVLAGLAASRGEREEARAQLVVIPAPSLSDSTPAAGDQLVAADRLVLAARAAWGRGEFQEAKNLFERASALDPGHHEARLYAASLLLEKHETRLARAALAPVLASYPQHPEALLLLARCHFADGAFRGADDACQAVLAANPDHPGALELAALLDLADENLHPAASAVEQALAVAPGSRPLQSVRAAILHLSKDQTGAEREVKALLAEAPRYAEVYVTMGGVLDRLRRFPEAGEFYRRALAIDPEHAAAANALGLSAMRDGREAEAAEWLDRGFELDRYNIRTYNMRLMLKKLAGYRRVETPHFVIKADEPDSPLVPLLASYLESVYAELCARFAFEPEMKTTVEVFAEPELLSARLIGLPGIEGIPAACFGSVIAMDSPRLWKGNIDWQTIIRHEFGHVLALTRTAKQVPFWFTEGLSEVLEGIRPTMERDRLARWALAEGELIPFADLNHGFTRAKSPQQRTLAYYESAFAIRRLIDQHSRSARHDGPQGFATVLAFLADYAAGRSTGDAVAAHLGITEAAWAAEVDSALRAHIAALPVWPLSSSTRLLERVQESSGRPDDLDARARTAEAWLQAGRLETAVSEALAILEADSTHAEARRVLGHALMREGEPLAAAEHLEKLLDRDEVDYLVLRDLGVIYADLGEESAAIAYLEEAIRIYPPDPEPYRKLAEIHRRAGRPLEAGTKLAAAAVVAEAPYDDLLALATLAKEHELGDIEVVALERSLALRPYEVEQVERLAHLYRQAGDAARAVRTYEALCLLKPDDLAAHRAIVDLALAHGPRETARRFASRLLELDPGNEAAQRVLERP